MRSRNQNKKKLPYLKHVYNPMHMSSGQAADYNAALWSTYPGEDLQFEPRMAEDQPLVEQPAEEEKDFLTSLADTIFGDWWDKQAKEDERKQNALKLLMAQSQAQELGMQPGTNPLSYEKMSSYTVQDLGKALGSKDAVLIGSEIYRQKPSYNADGTMTLDRDALPIGKIGRDGDIMPIKYTSEKPRTLSLIEGSMSDPNRSWWDKLQDVLAGGLTVAGAISPVGMTAASIANRQQINSDREFDEVTKRKPTKSGLASFLSGYGKGLDPVAPIENLLAGSDTERRNMPAFEQDYGNPMLKSGGEMAGGITKAVLAFMAGGGSALATKSPFTFGAALGTGLELPRIAKNVISDETPLHTGLMELGVNAVTFGTGVKVGQARLANLVDEVLTLSQSGKNILPAVLSHVAKDVGQQTAINLPQTLVQQAVEFEKAKPFFKNMYGKDISIAEGFYENLATNVLTMLAANMAMSTTGGINKFNRGKIYEYYRWNSPDKVNSNELKIFNGVESTIKNVDALPTRDKVIASLEQQKIIKDERGRNFAKSLYDRMVNPLYDVQLARTVAHNIALGKSPAEIVDALGRENYGVMEYEKADLLRQAQLVQEIHNKRPEGKVVVPEYENGVLTYKYKDATEVYKGKSYSESQGLKPLFAGANNRYGDHVIAGEDVVREGQPTTFELKDDDIVSLAKYAETVFPTEPRRAAQSKNKLLTKIIEMLYPEEARNFTDPITKTRRLRWEDRDGMNTMLELYNHITGGKEEFAIRNNKVSHVIDTIYNFLEGKLAPRYFADPNNYGKYTKEFIDGNDNPFVSLMSYGEKAFLFKQMQGELRAIGMSDEFAKQALARMFSLDNSGKNPAILDFVAKTQNKTLERIAGEFNYIKNNSKTLTNAEIDVMRQSIERDGLPINAPKLKQTEEFTRPFAGWEEGEIIPTERLPGGKLQLSEGQKLLTPPTGGEQKLLPPRVNQMGDGSLPLLEAGIRTKTPSETQIVQQKIAPKPDIEETKATNKRRIQQDIKKREVAKVEVEKTTPTTPEKVAVKNTTEVKTTEPPTEVKTEVPKVKKPKKELKPLPDLPSTKETAKDAGKLKNELLENTVHHSVRNNEDIAAIDKEGLLPGANLSENEGQGLNGDIVLVYNKKDLPLKSKSNPNEFIVSAKSNAKPVEAAINISDMPLEKGRTSYVEAEQKIESIAKESGVDISQVSYDAGYNSDRTVYEITKDPTLVKRYGKTIKDFARLANEMDRLSEVSIPAETIENKVIALSESIPERLRSNVKLLRQNENGNVEVVGILQDGEVRWLAAEPTKPVVETPEVIAEKTAQAKTPPDLPLVKNAAENETAIAGEPVAEKVTTEDIKVDKKFTASTSSADLTKPSEKPAIITGRKEKVNGKTVDKDLDIVIEPSPNEATGREAAGLKLQTATDKLKDFETKLSKEKKFANGTLTNKASSKEMKLYNQLYREQRIALSQYETAHRKRSKSKPKLKEEVVGLDPNATVAEIKAKNRQVVAKEPAKTRVMFADKEAMYQTADKLTKVLTGAEGLEVRNDGVQEAVLIKPPPDKSVAEILQDKYDVGEEIVKSLSHIKGINNKGVTAVVPYMEDVKPNLEATKSFFRKFFGAKLSTAAAGTVLMYGGAQAQDLDDKDDGEVKPLDVGTILFTAGLGMLGGYQAVKYMSRSGKIKAFLPEHIADKLIARYSTKPSAASMEVFNRRTLGNKKMREKGEKYIKQDEENKNGNIDSSPLLVKIATEGSNLQKVQNEAAKAEIEANKKTETSIESINIYKKALKETGNMVETNAVVLKANANMWEIASAIERSNDISLSEGLKIDMIQQATSDNALKKNLDLANIEIHHLNSKADNIKLDNMLWKTKEALMRGDDGAYSKARADYVAELRKNGVNVKELTAKDIDAFTNIYKLHRNTENILTKQWSESRLLDLFGIDINDPKQRQQIEADYSKAVDDIANVKTDIKELVAAMRKSYGMKQARKLIKGRGLSPEEKADPLLNGYHALKEKLNLLNTHFKDVANLESAYKNNDSFVEYSEKMHHFGNRWDFAKLDNPFGMSIYEVTRNVAGDGYVRVHDTESAKNQMGYYKTEHERDLAFDKFMKKHNGTRYEGKYVDENGDMQQSGFNDNLYEIDVINRDGETIRTVIRVNRNINQDINAIFKHTSLRQLKREVMELIGSEGITTASAKERLMKAVTELRNHNEDLSMLDDIYDFDGTKGYIDNVKATIRELENIKPTEDYLENTALINRLKQLFTYTFQPKSTIYWKNKNTTGWEPRSYVDWEKLYDTSIGNRNRTIHAMEMHGGTRKEIERQLLEYKELGLETPHVALLKDMYADLSEAPATGILNRPIMNKAKEVFNTIDRLLVDGVLVGSFSSGVRNIKYGVLTPTTRLIEGGEWSAFLQVPKALIGTVKSATRKGGQTAFGSNEIINEVAERVRRNVIRKSTSPEMYDKLTGRNKLLAPSIEDKLRFVQKYSEAFNRYMWGMTYALDQQKRLPFKQFATEYKVENPTALPEQIKEAYINQLTIETSKFISATQGNFNYLFRSKPEKVLLNTNLPIAGRAMLTLQAPMIQQTYALANVIKHAMASPAPIRKTALGLTSLVIISSLVGGISGVPFLEDIFTGIDTINKAVSSDWDMKNMEKTKSKLFGWLSQKAKDLGASDEWLKIQYRVMYGGLDAAVHGHNLNIDGGIIKQVSVPFIIDKIDSFAKTLGRVDADKLTEGMIDITANLFIAPGRALKAGYQLRSGERVGSNWESTGRKYGLKEFALGATIGKDIDMAMANEMKFAGGDVSWTDEGKRALIKDLIYGTGVGFEHYTDEEGKAIKDELKEMLEKSPKKDKILQTFNQIREKYLRNKTYKEGNDYSNSKLREFIKTQENKTVNVDGKAVRVFNSIAAGEFNPTYSGTNADAKKLQTTLANHINKYYENFTNVKLLQEYIDKYADEDIDLYFKPHDIDLSSVGVTTTEKYLEDIPLKSQPFYYALYKYYEKANKLGIKLQPYSR